MAVAGAFAMVALTSCHHHRVQPVLLPAQTPVALIEVPEPQSEPLVQEQSPKLPAVPTSQAAGKPKKAKKRSPKTSAGTAAPTAGATTATSATASAKKPADAAAATPPGKAESTVVEIGALTVGGEQSPRALQEANELIAANARRLTGLSADALKEQAELVGKVRNFQKEAQQALSSGDAEGAKTLATKGKLLLDDLDRGGSK